jgi:hypothetical protein
VVKDHESRNRQIELKAKLGKPTLDQARLLLGFGRHFGRQVEIPTPSHDAASGVTSMCCWKDDSESCLA